MWHASNSGSSTGTGESQPSWHQSDVTSRSLQVSRPGSSTHPSQTPAFSSCASPDLHPCKSQRKVTAYHPPSGACQRSAPFRKAPGYVGIMSRVLVPNPGGPQETPFLIGCPPSARRPHHDVVSLINYQSPDTSARMAAAGRHCQLWPGSPGGSKPASQTGPFAEELGRQGAGYEEGDGEAMVRMTKREKNSKGFQDGGVAAEGSRGRHEYT